jgi:hypothetical protein
MKRYAVYGRFLATRFIGVFEAESPEQAEQMAANSAENYASLCHQCAGSLSLSDSVAAEFDVEEEAP